MRRPIRIFLLTVALYACTEARVVSEPDAHSSDPAVYRAVLDSMAVPLGRNQLTRLIVADSTLTVDAQFVELEKLPVVDSAAVSDFRRRNSESHPLAYSASPSLRVPVVLVSRHTLDSFLGNGPEAYWQEFYRRWPGSNGSISFSSIGYSADGNLAVLAVDKACGSFCGALSNVVVRRELGRWRVTTIEAKIE